MLPVNARLLRIMPIFGVLPILCACAALVAPNGPIMDSESVLTSPKPWPTPLRNANDAKPQILRLWMNETTIPAGSNWYGRVIASTNVASLEIRTESFSFVAERSTYGDFRFSQHVLDMVPYYKRPYVLYVIARNAAGEQTQRLVRIDFR